MDVEKICQTFLICENCHEEIVLQQIVNNNNLSLKSKQLISDYFNLPTVNINWKNNNKLTPVCFKKFLSNIWLTINTNIEKLAVFDKVIQDIEDKGVYAKLIHLGNMFI